MQDPDYYGLLLQAALFGYTVIRTDPDRNSDGLAPAEGTIIVILVFLITVSGFRYLTTSQISLVKFRRRAARIRTYLGEAFRKCYGEENPIGTSPNKDLVLVLTMMGSLIVGATIVSWVVFKTPLVLISVLGFLSVIAMEDARLARRAMPTGKRYTAAELLSGSNPTGPSVQHPQGIRNARHRTRPRIPLGGEAHHNRDAA